MLLPRQAHHNPQGMLLCRIQQPTGRHRVHANRIDAVFRHQFEVVRYNLSIVSLLTIGAGPESAIGDAANVQLLIAHKEEFAMNARACISDHRGQRDRRLRRICPCAVSGGDVRRPFFVFQDHLHEVTRGVH